MKKISVIFTGGTIGSRMNAGGYIAPGQENGYRLLSMYEQQYGKAVSFETIQPYCILSENLAASDLLALIHAVGEQIDQLEQTGCEGIIVTHGTDTLQYSAAVLSYVFSHVQVPVVLVSSNYILDDVRANGLANFHAAVTFIEGHYGNGVFVSYCNQGRLPAIHYGTRLQSAVALSDRLESISDQTAGTMKDGRFIKCETEAIRVFHHTAAEPMFADYHQVRLAPQSCAVTRIQPYPGMSYPNLSDDVQVVLHESYHSGTIAVNRQLRDFMSVAADRKIPVYLTGLNSRENEYETVEQYRQLGIRPLPNSAVIAQYCKLWLLTSNHLEIGSYMRRNYAGEYVL